ncbi:hypothetical protein [Muricoccus pecuniae]|uniref:Uncharacterized protein n=1 Tax=Muricoccus pecuniae TaxID=693023 RepID=A0A840YIZ4_9PROT|nr:hypothetical protein [Roseomonas pecuniae]MBB5694622.1 hypothetical protein [Roseomonas pecuniae]
MSNDAIRHLSSDHDDTSENSDWLFLGRALLLLLGSTALLAFLLSR